jgi:hypothetical protein
LKENSVPVFPGIRTSFLDCQTGPASNSKRKRRQSCCSSAGAATTPKKVKTHV